MGKKQKKFKNVNRWTACSSAGDSKPDSKDQPREGVQINTVDDTIHEDLGSVKKNNLEAYYYKSHRNLVEAGVPNQLELKNSDNQQNCFLNAVLQALWQIKPSREALIQLMSKPAIEMAKY